MFFVTKDGMPFWGTCVRPLLVEVPEGGFDHGDPTKGVELLNTLCGARDAVQQVTGKPHGAILADKRCGMSACNYQDSLLFVASPRFFPICQEIIHANAHLDVPRCPEDRAVEGAQY